MSKPLGPQMLKLLMHIVQVEIVSDHGVNIKTIEAILTDETRLRVYTDRAAERVRPIVTGLEKLSGGKLDQETIAGMIYRALTS